MFAWRLYILLALLLLPLPATAARLPTDAPREGMAPHKALYDIQLVSKKSGSQILNIAGQMFFEWKPGCDAWTTDHRFNLYYEYADSPPLQINSDFSTYETYDGKDFNFSSRRKRNGNLYQEIRGYAEMGEKGGQAVYTMPEELVYDLKQETYFPMAHTLKLLDLANAGKKFFTATVFDGSDEDGPVEISAFIGKKTDPLTVVEISEDIDSALLNSPAWQVRMAFFPLLNPESDAEYEMSIVFHENGVISDMLVEYRDFAVTQKLIALDELEKADCTSNIGGSDNNKGPVRKSSTPAASIEDETPKAERPAKKGFWFWQKD